MAGLLQGEGPWALPFVAWAVTAAAFTVLLIAVAITDLRWRRIPNGLVAALAVLAALHHLLVGIPSVDWLGLVAMMVTAAGLMTLFGAGLLGAGDVKLMSACTLFLGPSVLAGFLLLVALSGGVLAGLWLLRGYLPVKLRPADERLPYGVAIASGAIGTLALATFAAPASLV